MLLISTKYLIHLKYKLKIEHIIWSQNNNRNLKDIHILVPQIIVAGHITKHRIKNIYTGNKCMLYI